MAFFLFDFFSLDDYTEEELELRLNELNKFPVIWNFFEFDKDTLTFKTNSEEYFNNRLQELENKKEDAKVKEEKYSIKAFLHLIKVNNYLEENSYMLYDMTDEEKERMTIENVRTGPKR